MKMLITCLGGLGLTGFLMLPVMAAGVKGGAEELQASAAEGGGAGRDGSFAPNNTKANRAPHPYAGQ
jgi:hypothetical protein